MLEVTEFIAILCTTVFTGAAIYVNLAEHPARMACGTELAATEWAPISFALIAIGPTNNLLVDVARDRVSAETRALLKK